MVDNNRNDPNFKWYPNIVYSETNHGMVHNYHYGDQLNN